MIPSALKPPCKPTSFICLVFTALVNFAPDAVQAQAPQDSLASKIQPLKANIVSSPPPSRTLSLSTCFQLAEQNNKEIISAKWNLSIAKAAIRIAGAIPNPQFQLQEGFGDSFSFLFDGQGEQIGWTQQFLTAGKRSKKLELARANYELAELQLKALRFDIHNRTRRAYAELVAAEAYAELIEAQTAVGQKLLSIAENRFNAGKAAQTEMLQAKLSVSQFNTLRNQAQIRLQQDSAALSLIIGERPEHIEVIDVDDSGLFKLSSEKTEIVPSPNRNPPSLERLTETAFSLRPDLQAAQQQVFASQKALKLARAQRIPDVYVGAGYAYAHWARHQPAGLNAVPNSIGNGVFLNVTAETPAFYQYQGEIQQAIGNLRHAERAMESLKCRTAADVVIAYNKVAVARANVFVFQKKLLPTASAVAQVARRGYQVGKTELATAIVAQQQYQQTLSNYFDVVVAYQNAWADLEKAVGVPLRS